MDLKAKIKQKSDRLVVQNALLQQQISKYVEATQFRSFLTTFILAPFVVGAITNVALGSKGTLSRQLCRTALLPGLRLWPFF